MLVVGQVVGAGLLLVGGWAALVVVGRSAGFGRVGLEERREVVNELLGEEDLGSVETEVAGFFIEVGKAGFDGAFSMRIMGRSGVDAEPVTVMTVDGQLTMDHGFSVRLPGGPWEIVADPVVWALEYCASHKTELLAAVEVSR